MKKFFVFALQALVVSLSMAPKQAFSCSVAINDNYEKNLLVAHAASHLDISIGSVTATTIAEYSKTLLGNVEPYDCPEYLSTQAKISFKYKKKKFQSCSASIFVKHDQYMGEEPGVPLYELDFSSITLACSTSSGVIIAPRPTPRPVPIPPIITPKQI